MDAKRLLTIPDKFRQTALGFPDQVEKALALVEDVDGAKALLDQADTLAHFAQRVRADTEIVNAIQYGKVKIIGKIGTLSPGRPPKEKGRGRKNGKAALPFSKPVISSYRKVARNISKLDGYRRQCGDKSELTIDGFIRFATGTEKAGRAAHVSANTGIPEWYTPAEYIEAARIVLKGIDLDPASSHEAQKTVRAEHYFTLEEDGLAQEWTGTVWLNPPYAADLVDHFVRKLVAYIKPGNEAILLVNNATETKWFQKAAKACSALCFPAGRIKFLDEDGNPGAPLQGQAILYFGIAIQTFIEEFQRFGFCTRTQ